MTLSQKCMNVASYDEDLTSKLVALVDATVKFHEEHEAVRQR